MTESQVPFTMFQIVDAIYLDENTVLALENAIFHNEYENINDQNEEERDEKNQKVEQHYKMLTNETLFQRINET